MRLLRNVARELPYLQREAVSLMVDACSITRLDPDAEWTEDPDTGLDVPPEPVDVYEGACKVQTWEPYEQSPEVGGQTYVRQRYFVHVPVSAGPFEVGDVVSITSSRNLPSTLNRKFRIAGLHEKTWQTAQRLVVDEGEEAK